MRRTDPSAVVVRLVRARDDDMCVRCMASYPLTTQHRIARGMGGSRAPGINLPANLITLCGSGTTGCHGWVEEHPSYAKAHGLALSRFVADPWRHPVWTWRGWVELHDDGHLRRLLSHPGVPGCGCGCRQQVAPAGSWETPALI